MANEKDEVFQDITFTLMLTSMTKKRYDEIRAYIRAIPEILDMNIYTYDLSHGISTTEERFFDENKAHQKR